jgi:ubiquinone biosynthesis protein COQ9
MSSDFDPNQPLEAWRGPLARAMRAHAVFDGWTDKALAQAAQDLGVDAAQARLAFPQAMVQMIAAASAQIDDDVYAQLSQQAPLLKIRERIALGVKIRLNADLPVREAVRRAAALLALPQHSLQAAQMVWRTADTLWRAAGDRSTDYNYYTKRTLLAAVYSTTLLVWLNDESTEQQESWAFLDRRIAGVMRFEKAKAEWRKTQERLPSLTRLLGRLRYPAA